MYDLSDDRGRYVGDWSNYLRHGYGVQQWYFILFYFYTIYLLFILFFLFFYFYFILF